MIDVKRGTMSGLVTVHRMLLRLVVVSMLFASVIVLHAPTPLYAQPTLFSTMPSEMSYLLAQGDSRDILGNDDTPTPVPPSSDTSEPSTVRYSWISILLCMVGLNVLTIVVALGFRRRFALMHTRKR